jgi:hypothetical protein
VLDPACGSANFLYVALEHMKRLEGEVLGFISELTQGQAVFESDGLTVDPHQFLGMEINPRAAQIAELVLWIGYLQWHYRLNDRLDLPEPILRDFKNIECRDALIEYDSREPDLDGDGRPVTIWDGISMKVSPTTGELIPDETGRATVYRYHNPRRADWPEADFIVGNPPFIGASTMRRSLGDGYVDAVRKVFKGVVPESADFVMYWWHIAAEKVRNEQCNRFGFITTNSLRQTFNRRVIEPHLSDPSNPLSLVFAVPDHPWVDMNDGAAVRIAMTVGAAGCQSGLLGKVTKEASSEDREARGVFLSQRSGKLFADLTIGADVASARSLAGNANITSRGVQLIGAGFIINNEESASLGLGRIAGMEQIIKQYRNGRDLTQKPRGVKVIDLFGLNLDEVRTLYPSVYQWVLERVKPERDQNNRVGYRKNWWIFGEARKDWRAMSSGLNRYIATVETAKHRVFTFLDSGILPDNKLVCLALENVDHFGVLTSRLHVTWSFASGSRLGVGNDPVYVKTRCLEAFPFPVLTSGQSANIGRIAEQIDVHRKKQQAQHDKLTLTNMYNVLEQMHSGAELTASERQIHEQGIISVLKELHDELDRSVFEAYGWEDLGEKLVGRPGATTPLPDKPTDQAEAEEELLMRLVALNKQRAQEEAQGVIHWLRPEYQAPATIQGEADVAVADGNDVKVVPVVKGKITFPKSLPEQLRVLREALTERAYTVDSLADEFKRKPKKSIEECLQSLLAVGVAEFDPDSGLWQSL